VRALAATSWAVSPTLRLVSFWAPSTAAALAFVWITISAIWLPASVRQRAVRVNWPSFSTARLWSFASTNALIRRADMAPKVSAAEAAFTFLSFWAFRPSSLMAL
jgi:hypothetical protein